MNTEKLGVLLISPLPPPEGGIATWTKEYIEWSHKNNLNVEIVNTSLRGKRALKINKKRNFADEIKRTAKIIEEVKIKLRKSNSDLVHLNTSCSKFGIVRDYICAELAKKNGKKLVVHYHCNIEDAVKENKVQNYYLSKIANIADKNLVLNNSSKQYLKEKTNNSSKLVSNFIDDTYILTDSKFIRNKIKSISYVGHIQRSKGFFEILTVAKEMQQIKFKLAGPISDEVQVEEVPSNIKFVGILNKQEIKKMFDDTDVFLFPSYTEGFSKALLEAMARGMPIITTPVGANKDMLKSAGGIIVGVGESIEIITAIQKMNDQKRRILSSSKNIEKVKKNYTTNKVMNTIVKEYIELVR